MRNNKLRNRNPRRLPPRRREGTRLRSARPRNPPRRRPNPRQRSTRVEVGRDIITTTTFVKPTDSVGHLIASINLNPADLPGTRLHQLAALWSRWSPLEMSIQVATSAGSLTSGSYAAGFTPSPEYHPPPGPSSVAAVSTLSPTLLRSIARPAHLSIPRKASQRWYSLESDDPFESSHGRFIVVLAAPIGNITTATSVNFMITLNWKVRFDGPALPSSESHDTVYAAAGYESYFTTSDSSFDSAVLTLKARSGGSAVEFPHARPETVYEIDPQASLKALSAKGEVVVKYAVRAFNYTYPIFVLFSDLTDAHSYASSGDKAHCLPYHSAGPIVTPSNPAWTAVTVSSLVQLVKSLKHE